MAQLALLHSQEQVLQEFVVLVQEVSSGPHQPPALGQTQPVLREGLFGGG